MPIRRFLPASLALLALACAGAPSRPGATPDARAADPDDVSSLPLREGDTHVVFSSDGQLLGMDDLLAELSGADVVLLGEEHDDPLTHRLQLEILREAFVRYAAEGSPPPAHGQRATPAGGGRPVVLSLEMFERDVQHVLDEYLAGVITEDHLLASARPWANYRSDYRPLLEFARAHRIPVVAANAPRRYVNRASRLGRDSLAVLSPAARRTIAPLPYPEPSARYRAQWDSLMGPAGAHVSSTALDGQTLWDATMGHSIAEALEHRPGALVIHLAGSFHVERDTGIPETLARYRPGTRVLSVVFKPEATVTGFEPARHLGYGDFVVLTRADGG